jgi:hypothetical protein
VRVDGDRGRRLPHLAHGVGLENLEAVALDHDAEEPKDVVEDDGLWVLGLDALGEVGLCAGHRLAQLAALGLELLQCDQAASVPARLGLVDEGPGEGLLALKDERVQRAPLLSSRAVRRGRPVRVHVAVPPVDGRSLQEALDVRRAQRGIGVVLRAPHAEEHAWGVWLERWLRCGLSGWRLAEFRTEVEDLFKDMLGRIDMGRLHQIIDVQGGRYLETPRDVVRALNALRLHAMPVRDQIDIPDMVWLQLAKIGKPQLYDWIEEYMTNVAGIVEGATLPDEAARDANNRLDQFLAGPDIDIVRARIDISMVLPGMGREFGDNDQQRPLYKIHSQYRRPVCPGATPR